MRTPRRLTLAIWLSLSVGVSACASDAAGDEDTASTSDTLAAPSTTTTVESTTTLATTTTVAATTTVESAPATTAVPTTTLPPTTTTEAPGAALPLRPDGIADARFGAEPDGVIGYISGVIGPPVEDTGWVDSSSLDCAGTFARLVRWADLTLWFGDDSSVSSGRLHFFGWSFGPAAEVQPSPAGLATPEGVSIGSSVVELSKAYPRASLLAGDETTTASAQISDTLLAYLTDTRDSGVIIAMVGGQTCSE